MPFSVFFLLFSKKLPSIGKRYFAHQYDFPSNRFFFKQGFIVCKKRVCRMGTVLTFCKLFCNVNDDENKKKSYAQNFSTWPWPRDLTQTSFFLRRWLNTGCSDWKLSNGNCSSSETMHVWPYVIKTKIGLRSGSFMW